MTNKPDPDHYTGWIETGWSGLATSRDSGWDTKALLNVPVVDGGLALRVSASYRDVPGYITKVGYPDRPGLPEVMKEDQNNNERVSARAALRWIISDEFETTLTYLGQRFDTKGHSAATPGAGDSLTGFGGIIDEFIDEDVDLYSLDLVADIGFAELTSNTAYFTERRLRLDDLTRYILEYSEASGLNYELYPEFFISTDGSHRTERFTQELRLVSAKRGSLIDYVAGVFYLDQGDEGGPNRMPAPGLSEFLNELYFGPGEESVRPDDNYLLGHGETDTTELALYGEATFNLGDRWDITLGGRWFDYETSGYTDTAVPTWEELQHKLGAPSCAPTQGGTDPTLFPCTHGHTVMDTGLTDFVYKLGVSYEFDDADALLFVTIAEGYRPGGANYVDAVTLETIDPGLLSYDPDKATSYEIGIKSMLLDNRLQLNASIYRLDWEDAQLTTGLSGVEWILNGGDARVNGLEIDLTALLSDSLSVDFTLSRLDAELTEDTLITPDVDGQKGDRLPGSAELQANFALRFETELAGNTRWWTRLSGSYCGDVNAYLNDNDINQFIDPPVLSENRFFEQIPGYSVWNVHTGFEWNEWSAFAYVDNVFDERYIVATSTFEQGPVEDPISRRHYYGRPRAYGVTLRYDF